MRKLKPEAYAPPVPALRRPQSRAVEMNFELKFCSVGNYEPKAVSLANKLLTVYKQRIKSFNLVPSGGGSFELWLDGQLIFSKLKSGVFPDEDELIELINAKLLRR